LEVLTETLEGVRIVQFLPQLQQEKEKVSLDARSAYSLETLKDQHPIRAYRDFFWRAGIDPTKNRPASEALIRRILSGKPLPTINTLVDSYNLASIRSGVPIAAFDGGKIRGDLKMRFAKKGEEFLGIGMIEPMRLNGNEIVIQDEVGLTAVYPYRDADRTKIGAESSVAVLLFCGAPGIENGLLRSAAEWCIKYVMMFCDGTHNRL
jgi:DNA/RNA-binding domain of Phe-tRNA-synthetase-like protein